MLLDHAERDRVLDLEPVADVADVLAAPGRGGAVHGSEALRRYVVAILDATRADPRVELGASPRAGLMLFRAAKAFAALDGRDHALPDDVQALAARCSRTACCSPPGAGTTSAPPSCATRWSESRRSDRRCSSPARHRRARTGALPGGRDLRLALALRARRGPVRDRGRVHRVGAARGQGRRGSCAGRARTRCWRTSPTRSGSRSPRACCRRPAASFWSRCSAGPSRSPGAGRGACGSTCASGAAAAACSSPGGS